MKNYINQRRVIYIQEIENKLGINKAKLLSALKNLRDFYPHYEGPDLQISVAIKNFGPYQTIPVECAKILEEDYEMFPQLTSVYDILTEEHIPLKEFTKWYENLSQRQLNRWFLKNTFIQRKGGTIPFGLVKYAKKQSKTSGGYEYVGNYAHQIVNAFLKDQAATYNSKYFRQNHIRRALPNLENDDTSNIYIFEEVKTKTKKGRVFGFMKDNKNKMCAIVVENNSGQAHLWRNVVRNPEWKAEPNYKALDNTKPAIEFKFEFKEFMSSKNDRSKKTSRFVNIFTYALEKANCGIRLRPLGDKISLFTNAFSINPQSIYPNSKDSKRVREMKVDRFAFKTKSKPVSEYDIQDFPSIEEIIEFIQAHIQTASTTVSLKNLKGTNKIRISCLYKEEIAFFYDKYVINALEELAIKDGLPLQAMLTTVFENGLILMGAKIDDVSLDSTAKALSLIHSNTNLKSIDFSEEQKELIKQDHPVDRYENGNII